MPINFRSADAYVRSPLTWTLVWSDAQRTTYPLSLTPALSRWERGNVSLSSAKRGHSLRQNA